MSLPRNQLLLGQAVDRLRELSAASIDCVITSPPYFRLRDYGVAGQIGLEDRIEQWVADLLAVLDEVQRVLVPTGTVWLNLGDSYSTHLREGAERKGLLLGPERLALALSARGWLLRNKIVWAKPSTVPSSVRDRLSTRHEVIYLLARQPQYFFDLDAIRVPHTSRPPTPRRSRRPPSREDATRPAWLGPNADHDRGLAAMHARGIVGHPLGKNPGDVWTDGVSRYRGAHFATYPLSLVSRMLRAGCPERRCAVCSAPWQRTLRRRGTTATRGSLTATCHCRGPTEPGLVLDPFMGAGTTAVAAEALDRDWLGIELNPAFITLAEQRLTEARQAETNE